MTCPFDSLCCICALEGAQGAGAGWWSPDCSAAQDCLLPFCDRPLLTLGVSEAHSVLWENSILPCASAYSES